MHNPPRASPYVSSVLLSKKLDAMGAKDIRTKEQKNLSICNSHAPALTLLLKIAKQFLGGVRRSREVVRFNYELWTMHYALMEASALLFFCLKYSIFSNLNSYVFTQK